MAERGGRCRPSRERETREAEPFEVKRDGEDVLVTRRGRLVRRLAGRAADEVRRALEAGEEEAVQWIVLRQIGR